MRRVSTSTLAPNAPSTRSSPEEREAILAQGGGLTEE